MKPDPAIASQSDAQSLAIDIDVKAGGWQASLKDHEALCRQTLSAAMTHLDLPMRSYEVSVVLTDDAEQKILNSTYRGREVSTNVLSFPTDEMEAADFPTDMPMPLGDITMALETLVNEAADGSLRDHFCHLLVHGMLHLVGYDHETNDDAECMEALEIRILDALGIKNPYADSADTIQD